MITRKFRKQFGISWVAVVLSFTCSPTLAADSVAPLSVLIVYHSASGNTEKMAQAVAEGAKGISGAKVLLKRVGEVAAEDLVSSDAVIVGTPVYFGNMSGEVKTFFDNWNLKFRLSQERRMANKVGGGVCDRRVDFQWEGTHHTQYYRSDAPQSDDNCQRRRRV